MTVKEIKPNILYLEYRQEKIDKDYGSCLWARFMFNLDRYELSITSDCGNYGYKWVETPESESFLELMARCADVFDYEATKKRIYEYFGEDEEDKEKLDETFEEMEIYGCSVDSPSEFMRVFEDNNDNDFGDVWELLKYVYPSNALKIVEVFKEYIQPYIREQLKEQNK